MQTAMLQPSSSKPHPIESVLGERISPQVDRFKHQMNRIHHLQTVSCLFVKHYLASWGYHSKGVFLALVEDPEAKKYFKDFDLEELTSVDLLILDGFLKTTYTNHSKARYVIDCIKKLKPAHSRIKSFMVFWMANHPTSKGVTKAFVSTGEIYDVTDKDLSLLSDAQIELVDEWLKTTFYTIVNSSTTTSLDEDLKSLEDG